MSLHRPHRQPRLLPLLAVVGLLALTGCGSDKPSAASPERAESGEGTGDSGRAPAGESGPDGSDDGEGTVCDVLTPAEVEEVLGVEVAELREPDSYASFMANLCEYVPPGADPEDKATLGVRMEITTNKPGIDAFSAMPGPKPGLLGDPEAKASVIDYKLRIQKAGQILNIYFSHGDLSREEREAALVELGEAAVGRLPNAAVPVGDEADEGDETGAGASDSVDPDEVCLKVPYSVVDTVGTSPVTGGQGVELAGDIRGTDCVYLSADGIVQAEVALQPTGGDEALTRRRDVAEGAGSTIEAVPELGDGAFTYTGSHERRVVMGLDEDRKALAVTVYEVDQAQAVEFWKAVADLL